MDFYEEARSEELGGPGERARCGQPSVSLAKLVRDQVTGHL